MPDKDVIKGQIKHVEGHVEEAIGDLTDDPKRKAQGQAKMREGKRQETAGHLKDAIRSATDEIAKS
jgi:uncharacterized protein YjbJ (UPF0337 family)